MNLTLLTALVDLERGGMGGRFERRLDYYTDSLSRLLSLPFKKVIYLDPRIHGFEEDANTRIVRVAPRHLQMFPHYDRVQEIRTDPRWYEQVGWLVDSPQCRLADYNPLVMSKMIWLHELAQSNPFQTDGAFWLDAGIYNNELFSHYGEERFIRETIKREFSCLLRSCHDPDEVHGFERDAFDHYCGGRFIDAIVPGGLFGGSIDALKGVHGDYMRIMKQTLDEGYMGTEENLLTILVSQIQARQERTGRRNLKRPQ